MPRLNANRGQFLLSFGFIYLAIGLTYMFVKQPVQITHAMAWMPAWSTIQVCGLAWVITGVIAMVMAFVPIPYDRFGFMALAGWATAWATAWAISWVIGDSPVGYIAALVYGALGMASLSVSGMANPVRRRLSDPGVGVRRRVEPPRKTQ